MTIYTPPPIPFEYSALRTWVAVQLRRVADVLQSPTLTRVRFVTLHAEPERYDEGDVVLADGTDWNPGSGNGLYARLGGAWVKL